MVYLGSMFFEVHTWIFVQLIFFEVLSSIFFFMFTEVLMKDIARKLIHVRKIFNCSVSKCCFRCVSHLLERNFEHSCDQVTFKMLLCKKMPWQRRKPFSSERPFLPLVLNKNNNNKHAEYHGDFILFKVQIYSK